MNSVICPLCESTENQYKFLENGYSLLQCNNCELLFIDPYPYRQEDRHLIVQDYTFDDLTISAPKEQYLAEVEFYNEYFEQIANMINGARTLLDVGCGTGRLLELMKKKGVECAGVELNEERALVARSRSRCQIYQVPVEKLHSDKKYDAITLINVLSHIPSLPQLFQSINQLLNENGKVVLVVGEMRCDVEQGDVLGWSIPDHLHFLGMNTIRYISMRFGYNILVHVRKPYSTQLFSKFRFKAPARNLTRTIIKRIIFYTPFAIRFLKHRYDKKSGGRVFTSVVVLEKGII
jgi:SAM-dependent methyltransferase